MYRRGEVWWTKLATASGRRADISLGTRDEKTAAAMEGLFTSLRMQHDPLGVLDLVLDRTVTPVELYRRGPQGAAAIANQRATEAARVDLSSHVPTWLRQVRNAGHGHGTASTARYERQFKQLYPETPLYADTVTAADLWRRLDALEVSPVTRSRYRAAASSFFQFCVRKGLLDQNPARQVTGLPSSPVGDDRLTAEQAQELIAALPDGHRGLEAVMAGCGVEWQVVERLRVRDVRDEGAWIFIEANGSKTPWRNREVLVTEQWTYPYIREAIANKAPDALVFEGITNREALRVHHATAESLGLPHTRLHSWRHSYAVWLLRRGESPAFVAHQLGHSNSYLVLTRYGKEAVNVRAYRLVTGFGNHNHNNTENNNGKAEVSAALHSVGAD